MKPVQVVIGCLAVGCVLLAAGAALLLGGVGQEISPATPLERPDWVTAGGLDGDEFALPPLETYAEVTNRPLFNEDRQPTPPGSQDSDVDETDLTDQTPAALDVTVTGIIITPEKKLAMVVDNTTKQQLRLTEGMPLEGEQSSWTLTSIEARKLVFDGGASEPQEVELETYTRALKGGARPRARATPVSAEPQPAQAAADAAAAEAATASDDDRAARAEEIRRRVAERRAQLREEAERRRLEQQQENDNE